MAFLFSYDFDRICYRNDFFFLSICKLRRITSKLSKALCFMLNLSVIRRCLRIDKNQKNKFHSLQFQLWNKTAHL